MFLGRLSSVLTSWSHRGYNSTRRMASQAERSADTPNERTQDLLKCFNKINQQVQQAASGREVRLVAVSKLKPASDILTLYQTTGHLHFGENYVSELQEKVKTLPEDIKWHFIGALQSNKCKILGAIPNLYAVETVDSLHKAQLLEKARSGLTSSNRIDPLQIYLQVNTSEEATKAGFITTTKEPILSSNLIQQPDTSKKNRNV
ncbi:hypothetical protein H4Q26_013611 [Puccinia striiformis f. sp. tritici PST-130]|nr:hypothetical protein H4Q26_013611 [Puccinia striiformis f. sp. tritici PST-130]